MSPPFGSAATTTTALLLLALISAAHGHNITLILERAPQYSSFNEILSKTGLAKAINNHKTITVLAVPNDQIGRLAGQTPEVQDRVLRAHVILDYFDLFKLRRLPLDKKTQVTTLYQQSGTADGMQGFLDIVRNKDNSLNVFSAVRNAPADVKLGDSVAQLPYNISVIGISQSIVVPGLDGTLVPVSAPPPKTLGPVPADKESPPPAETPTEAGPEADPPSEAPGSDGNDTADTPAKPPPAADADATPPPPPPQSGAAGDIFSVLSTIGVLFLGSFILA